MRSNDEETHLAGPDRYDAFVRHVAKGEVLWILESPTSVLMFGDAEGRDIVPVWPTMRSAAGSRSPEEVQEGFAPQAVPLTDWLERSTASLIEENLFVGVFPGMRRAFPVVPADRLARDLRSAMRVPKLQGADLARQRRNVMRRKSKF
jgi:hypothetical protein